MFDDMWGTRATEAFLDCFQHNIADIRTGDPGIGDSHPRDDLSIKRVDDESEADHLAVAAGELQAIGAPTKVRPHHLTLPSWTLPFRTAVGFSRIMAWLVMMR